MVAKNDSGGLRSHAAGLRDREWSVAWCWVRGTRATPPSNPVSERFVFFSATVVHSRGETNCSERLCSRLPLSVYETWATWRSRLRLQFDSIWNSDHGRVTGNHVSDTINDDHIDETMFEITRAAQAKPSRYSAQLLPMARFLTLYDTVGYEMRSGEKVQ